MTRGWVAGATVSLVVTGWAVSVHAAVDAPAAVPASVRTWTGRIAAGDNHTCTVRTDGTVWCWGDNQFGQLGNSNYGAGTSLVPRQASALPGGRTAVSITAGKNHTCVLANDGTVWCWGDNGYKELGGGVGAQYDAIQVPLGAGITATRVTAGGNTACAHTSNGSLTCWGRNYYGQIGNGSTQASGGVAPVAVNSVPAGFTVRDVDPGGNHMCAAADAGSVHCWGSDIELQLGTAADASANKSVPTGTDSTGGSVRSVATGGAYSCALLAAGTVRCWGDNQYGQLARGSVTPTTSAVPTAVSLSATTVRVAAGVHHACALAGTGDLWCWGRNQSGQVGDNTVVTPKTTPVQVASPGGAVVDVAAGLTHTCALIDDGSVRCWGDNTFGQIGAADGLNRTVPTAVEGLDTASTAASLASSVVTESSARVSASVSVPTGETSFAVQASTSATFASGVTTRQLGTWGRVVQASASAGHSCAVLPAGTVSCSGSNTDGELGNGTFESSTVPVNPVLAVRALSVTTGGHHTCAVVAGGAVRCWGAGVDGQLGQGESARSKIPVVVALGAGEHAVDASAGSNGTCAVLDSGAVRCWGANTNGELGNGNTNATLAVVTVATGGEPALAVSAGDHRACAVIANGTARCWGAGPAGDGTSGNATTPVAVSTSSSTVRQVSAGAGHACALLAGGSVECWGNNAVVSSALPVAVSFGAGAHAVAIASSGAAVCARLSTGSVQCAGEPGDASARATNALDPATVASHSSRTLSANLADMDSDTTHWFRFVVTHAGTVTETAAVSFATLATTTTAQETTTLAPAAGQQAVATTAPTTTSGSAATTTTTAIVAAARHSVRLRTGHSISASRIAKAVGLFVPRKSQGTLRLSIVTGQKRCVFRGSAVRAVRAGTCDVRVTFIRADGAKPTAVTLHVTVVR